MKKKVTQFFFELKKMPNRNHRARGAVKKLPTRPLPKGANLERLNKDIAWCVKQLELGLQRTNPAPDEYQIKESKRVMRILQSKDTPVIKKRALMTQVFGSGYQKRIEKDEQ